jgi:hypothetical protein
MQQAVDTLSRRHYEPAMFMLEATPMMSLACVVQAAKMARHEKLHATLVNNLATSLVKQSKPGQALTVHKIFLDDLTAHSITSSYTVLARHSVIDILATHKQHADCEALLEDQVSKLHSHYMQTLAEYKQHATSKLEDKEASAESPGEEGQNGQSEKPAEAPAHAQSGTGVSAGDVALALQALARCHLDYGKHYDGLKDRKKAVQQGRKAMAHYQEAQKYRVDVNPVYLSFMASQLKSFAEFSKACGDEDHVKLFKEARQLYRDLMEAVEVSGKQRNVQQLHRTIANLSVEIGDTETVWLAALHV